MIGRIVRSADFERVLASKPRHRSAHFAAHFAPQAALRDPAQSKLSTTPADARAALVDESTVRARWLGAVVPKRHARRAVTRNLIKRQIHAAALRHAAGLEAGWWVVRLKAPFDAARFSSAASNALREAARGELDSLLARVASPASEATP
jgi:ribonuclease P protein component